MSPPENNQLPKTVFIVVPQGFAARTLLRTDLLGTLKAAGVRIVLLVPNVDEPYMAEEFAAENVHLEPLRTDLDAAMARWPRLRVLYSLRHYALPRGDKTLAFMKRYAKYRANIRAQQPAVAWAVHALVWLSWRSRTLRRLLLAAERQLFPAPLHQDLFDRYRPDLVVATSPGYFKPDAILLREARRNRVESVCVVLGWDNPTSEGYGGPACDYAVVWSESMAEQMVAYQDFPRERIFVGGVPHFDRYARPAELLSRDALFDQLGLDPARRLIVFATSTPGAYEHNVLVAEALARAIEDAALGSPAQLVVRMHPIFFHPRYGAHRVLKEFEAVRARHAHMHIDVPEVQSAALRCDMPASDSLKLGSLLKHCDVLVNVFSTTTLEAFLLDRPVVLVNSNAHRGGIRRVEADEPWDANWRVWDEYVHIRALIDQGAARVAETLPQMVELVRAYVEDPTLDREQRLRAAREECGPTDGHAGERIGAYLLARMGVPAPAPQAEERRLPAPGRASAPLASADS